MGMYTELILGAELKEDTPKDVIETLRYFAGEIERPEKLAVDLGMNWPILRGGSYYFAVNHPVVKMWFDDIGGSWKISSRNNIKNYGNEIENFLAWLKP